MGILRNACGADGRGCLGSFISVLISSAIQLAGLASLGIVLLSPAAPAEAQLVDTRINSMSYWQELLGLGLVSVVSQAPEPGPVFQGSELQSQALVQDSPDVAITSAGNTTQSENSVFIDPQDSDVLFNSNNSSDYPVTQIYGASTFTSLDGSQTWQGSIFGAGGNNRGDPAAAIDQNGRFFVGYIAANSGQGVAHSNDQGQTFTHVQVAPNPGSIADKNHLWVDNSLTSPHQGNLYSAWTDFGGPFDSRIVLSRSTNGGLAWSPRVNISAAVGAGSHDQGVNLQTAPNGDVYAVWAVYDAWPAPEVALGFARSTNGGATWQPAVRILTNIRGIRSQAPGGGLGGGKTMRTASFPSMTVDPAGVIHVVWANYGVPGTNTGDPDIYLMRSSDGGNTWTTPTRVNQDPIDNGRDQWFPWIASDPVTGDLGCIFYDSRNFALNDMAETFVAISTDGGDTWQDFRVSDVAWAGDGLPGFANNYAGDYLGIDIQDRRVFPVWSDTRAGNMLAYASPFKLVQRCDVNDDGVVDAGDAFLVERFATGQLTPDPNQLAAADLAPSGAPDQVINEADLLLILRALRDSPELCLD